MLETMYNSAGLYSSLYSIHTHLLFGNCVLGIMQF